MFRDSNPLNTSLGAAKGEFCGLLPLLVGFPKACGWSLCKQDDGLGALMFSARKATIMSVSYLLIDIPVQRSILQNKPVFFPFL